MISRAILFSLAIAALSQSALAQAATKDEQDACAPDVRRFCYKVKESEGTNAFLQCLQAHRAKLSVKCRTLLESHGV